jgi:hypothetical protein
LLFALFGFDQDSIPETSLAHYFHLAILLHFKFNL